MKSEPIYKRDTAGNIRVWQYEVDAGSWRTIAGIKDGNLVTSAWTVCTPKSKPTAFEQALFEAHAEHSKKLARDYREALLDVDRQRASVVKPMLAEKYDGWQGPCFSQPKLDGIRCIATRHGLYSRQGKEFVSVPHIHAALSQLFEHTPDAILDGELYNHDLHDDFNAITSAVKRLKPSAEDLATSAQLVQYHVYDMPSHQGTFTKRHRALQRELPIHEVLRAVPTDYLHRESELDQRYTEYLEQNYEGQMVRLDGSYEQKRSKLLLKRKEFLDGEFPVVEIQEGIGNWAGYAKRATLTLPDGRQFGAGLRGTQAQMKALLNGPKPTTATVRYFTPTPDGIPRFAVAVAFHDGERI